MSQYDPFTPCDDALQGVYHKSHSYVWADQLYNCRGFPGVVVVTQTKRWRKQKLRHRLMDWIMTLSTAECYILAGAIIFAASVLFFTVIWSWVMFGFS